MSISAKQNTNIFWTKAFLVGKNNHLHRNNVLLIDSLCLKSCYRIMRRILVVNKHESLEQKVNFNIIYNLGL